MLNETTEEDEDLQLPGKLCYRVFPCGYPLREGIHQDPTVETAASASQPGPGARGVSQLRDPEPLP